MEESTTLSAMFVMDYYVFCLLDGCLNNNNNNNNNIIKPVLLCSVLRRFVHVTGCGKHLS